MTKTEKIQTAQAVRDNIKAFALSEGKTHSNLTLFPVFLERVVDYRRIEYRTLSEGLNEGWAHITEAADATVPMLVLNNTGAYMVLIIDGEEIVGGLQNRIANASFLVGASSQFEIPVSCVEMGRWHEESKEFRSGDRMPRRMNAAKMERVNAAAAGGRGYLSDQGAVWSAIREMHDELNITSPTSAVHDAFVEKKGALAEYENNLPHFTGASGMIAAINGTIIGAEVFDQPRTARALWPKLVRSFAMDAIRGPAHPTQSVDVCLAKAFVERFREGNWLADRSAGLGYDVRCKTAQIIGASLVFEGMPIHTSLFSLMSDTRDNRRGTGLASAHTRPRPQSPPGAAQRRPTAAVGHSERVC